MTLSIGTAGPVFVVSTSDRLVTLANPRGAYVGKYDEQANKTLVLSLRDALVIVTFAGSAYIEGVPTDEWLADLFWGKRSGGRPSTCAGVGGSGKGANPTVNDVLFAVRDRVAKLPTDVRLALMFVGIRFRRNRAHTFIQTIDSVPARTLTTLPKLRAVFQRHGRYDSIGVAPPYSEVRKAGARRQQPFDPSTAAEVLEEAIREVSRRDQTVGPHTMSVIAHRNGEVRCRFTPDAAHFLDAESPFGGPMPTAFSPWLIYSRGYFKPSLIGRMPLSVELDRWSVTIEGHGLDAGPLIMVAPQQRMKPPRAR